ncbi:MAG: alpha-D-ribose 1-methylphosphonate 5-triphosphate diphosphatase [Notoacmeibacter sp.]
MNQPTIFENAHVVTADDVFSGYVVVEGDTILEVGKGSAPERGLDFRGDLLIPGLVELHTDNIEAHFMPRPKVMWNIDSAVTAYDSQIAASGITTVFDSLRVGRMDYDGVDGFAANTLKLANAIADAQNAGHLRAEHLTHIRCEVAADDVVVALANLLEHHPIHMISLMDHTPGQRQFRDIDKYFIYFGGKSGKSDAEVRAIVEYRQRVGATGAAKNRPDLVALAQANGILIASHDDTTIEEVAQSKDEGITLAEFPTTVEAAAACREAGLATIMGGPNVVRGGSHSGNVAAQTLAEEGLLDILSSDYVPASLLMGALALENIKPVGGLPGAIRLVTKNPAEATGLMDRGEIAIGKRADIVRVHRTDRQPVVRQVWRQGTRII